MRKISRQPEARGGFTLLELIAVIGIVVVMTTLVVGGYNGMMTSLAEGSAVQTIERALSLARQEAAIDGNDTYFFLVDVDKFALVRKAGVVTDVKTGTQAWGVRDQEVTPAKWIVDAYADLADRMESLGYDPDDKDAKAIQGDYEGSLVFNIDKGVMACVRTPARWVGDTDAWVFGVDDLPNFSGGAASFGVNDAYGWISHPVFTLPEGWVFADSHRDGVFDATKAKVCTIHYEPGGNIEKRVELELENPTTERTFKVIATQTGVRRGNNGGNNAGN